MVDKAVEKICPELTPHIEKLKTFQANELACDETYTAKFVAPTLLAIAGATSGATKVIPGFEKRFTGAMLHVRDELCVICKQSNTVSLTQDSAQRFPQVLLDGFKKSA